MRYLQVVHMPADYHLFQVRPEDERMILNKERSTASHHTMAQLLFVTSRARKDTKMAIYLLCTRKMIPDKDYWGNLVMVLRYIRGTLNLPLILRDVNLSVIK